MNITFEGFQSALPLGIYVLLFLLSVTLAWWSYRHYRSISTLARFSLAGLRAMVFFILLALLANPLLQTVSVEYNRSSVAVLLDNSQSVGIEKGRYEGADTYRRVLNTLNLDSRQKVDLSFWAIGESLSRITPDSLDYKATETNLYQAIQHVKQHSGKLSAAILLTDGIFTAGQAPGYISRTLETPIYVVGLGDTVSVQDLVVKNVITSNEGYTKTQHSVKTTIINDGFKNETIKVQLRSGNELVASKSLQFTETKSAHTVNFTIPLQEKGLHQYEIRIPQQKGEWTDANNAKTFSIDVKSNKDRVLHLAFGVHPDVKTVRTVLSTNKNVALSYRTWLGGTQFVNGGLPEETDTLDLVILHGYPPSDLPSSINRQVIQLAEELPVLFLGTPGRQLSDLPPAVQPLFPLSVQGTLSPLETNIYPVESYRNHPVMELPELSYSNLPTLYAPIKNVKKAPGSKPLFNVLYRGNKSETPFIVIQQLGNQRSAVINGYGIYRLKQHQDPTVRSFITKLIHNLVSWTAAETGDQLLSVEPAQQVFDGDDAVRLNAYLRNESGKREANATIDITIHGENMKPKTYTMNNEGEGKYSLNLGTRPEGIYSFKATATKGNRTIDTYEGEFSVARTRIEYVNTTRNEELLKQIASGTGGRYYDFARVDSLWNHLQKSGLTDQKKTRTTSPFYPYRHAFWFIIVVLLLGSEWLARKYYALP